MRRAGLSVFPKNAPDQSAMTGLEGQPPCMPIMQSPVSRKLSDVRPFPASPPRARPHRHHAHRRPFAPPREPIRIATRLSRSKKRTYARGVANPSRSPRRAESPHRPIGSAGMGERSQSRRPGNRRHDGGTKRRGRGWLWLRSTATRLQPHTSQGREANARRRSRSRKPPRGAKRTKAGREIA